MMSLPFLVPAHRLPLPAFESEWLALVLGLLCVSAVLLQRTATLLLPPVILAPVLLALVVLGQMALGLPAYASNGMVFCGYLAWATMLAVAGRQCVAGLGAAPLYRLLAASVLGAGALSAAAGLIQYANMAASFASLGLVNAPSAIPGEGVYGNLAQQNHFATQIALATASAVYLFGAGHIGRTWFASAILLLTVALVLSGSRSVLLYGLWIGIAFAVFRAGRLPWRTLGAIVLALLLIVGALLTAAHFGWLGQRLARLVAFEQGLGPRAFLWGHAWQMFVGHPWLGVGVDRYAHTLIEQLQSNRYNWGIDQYAHNLLLQLLALTGLAGTAALMLPLAAWLRRVMRARPSFDALWAATVLGILAIHSMLEQPLHYAYFLGIAAFVAGGMDPACLRVPLLRWARWPALAALGAGLLGMGITWQHYDSLSERFYGAGSGATLDGSEHALIMRVHRNPLFKPLAELISPASFVPIDAPVAAKLALNARLAAYAPTADVLFRHSALLAEAGKAAQARQQFERAAVAYPAEVAAYAGRFVMLAQHEPERYGELARFAQQYVATTVPPARPF